MSTQALIDVRVEFTACGAVWWTGPIRNPRALDALLSTGKRRPSERMQVHDDDGHKAIADAAMEIGRRERTLSLLTWGNGRYCCEIAPLPRATGELDPEPRDLRGPSAEEVAEHTPLIMAFDYGGGRRKKSHAETRRRRGRADVSMEDKAASLRVSASPREDLPLPAWLLALRSALDRAAAWLLRRLVPQGKELPSDR